jgi:hypothetical protein
MRLLRQPSGLRSIPTKGWRDTPVAAFVSPPTDEVSELRCHGAGSTHTYMYAAPEAASPSHQGGSQVLQQRQQRT